MKCACSYLLVTRYSLLITFPRSIFFLLLFVTLGFCHASSQSSAEAILQAARLRPTAQPLTLAAEIRGADEPLALIFKIEQGAILYQLHDPDETIILKLGGSSSSLSTTKKGTSHAINDEKRFEEIRNSGVTYDDLSLGFLYWPHPHLIGNENIRGTHASLLELTPSEGHLTPYGSARLWIDERSNAPLRMEGYDAQGKLLKRFEVLSAQKIDGLWTLKEMRIETFDPMTGKITQRRYLTIDRNYKKN